MRSGADVRDWDITKQIKHRFSNVVGNLLERSITR